MLIEIKNKNTFFCKGGQLKFIVPGTQSSQTDTGSDAHKK